LAWRMCFAAPGVLNSRRPPRSVMAGVHRPDPRHALELIFILRAFGMLIGQPLGQSPGLSHHALLTSSTGVCPVPATRSVWFILHATGKTCATILFKESDLKRLYLRPCALHHRCPGKAASQPMGHVVRAGILDRAAFSRTARAKADATARSRRSSGMHPCEWAAGRLLETGWKADGSKRIPRDLAHAQMTAPPPWIKVSFNLGRRLETARTTHIGLIRSAICRSPSSGRPRLLTAI
jgi:hypothetical protein